MLPNKSASFRDYVLQDLLGDIPGIRAKSMFGGFGIYQEDVFFALIADGRLFFRADDANRPEYERLGSEPFAYSHKDGRKTTMSYWQLPEEIMNDREKLSRWVVGAVEAAKRGGKGKK